MTIDDFLSFLGQKQIEYHETGNSIVFEACPSCQGKDKVWLYKDRKTDAPPFFGSCFKCGEKWNSRTYLVAMGVDEYEVKKLHGFDGELNLNLTPAIDPLGKATEVAIEEVDEPIDISDFVPIPTWLDHPASQYAIKRGFTPVQSESILLDYQASAVAFIVRNAEGKPIGYQRRFLRPPAPHLKTMSSVGFKKLKWVLEFPNNGDICVCEGPFTALSAWHYGYHAVCTFGCEVGEAQLHKIAALATRTGKGVGVAFDLDDAGRKGYRRVSMAIFWEGSRVYKVRPETGNDLNNSWTDGKGCVVISSEEEDVTVPDIGLDRMFG